MKNSFLIAAVLITLLSCKKPDSTPPTTTPATQPNTTTTLSYTLDAQGNPSGTYNGIFNVSLLYNYQIPPDTLISCSFFNVPQSSKDTGIGYANIVIAVNSVTVNGNKFGGGLSLFYQDTTGIAISPPYKWVVNGKSPIPSFTYISPTLVPVYNALAQLPDTISSQQNLILPLSQASGYDMFSVVIADVSYRNKVQFSVSNVASSVIIPADSLAKFSGASMSIGISLTKFNPQTVAGKNFLFSTQLIRKKMVTIQ